MTFLKKILEKIKNFIKWVWNECKDWRTLVVFAIVWVFIMSPFFIGYILFLITNNGWHLTYANGWILFWAGPFTPTIPLCLTITFAIKKLFQKNKDKRKNKNVSNSKIEK